MEKLQFFTKRHLCNRLLKIIFLTFVFCSGSAYSITHQEIRQLVIRPEENIYFTNQEVKYVLEIPDTNPNDVQTQLQTLKDGTSFISSRRMEYFTDAEENGTRIEFWFSFKNPGTIEMLPLIVKVKGWIYNIPFEKIDVYENPKTIAPQLIVELNKDKILYPHSDSQNFKTENFVFSAGRPIEIMVYIQYAVQIKQFGYEIPKDSLFDEITRYEIVKGKKRMTEFSKEKIPVAKFNWTPLKDGKYSLPDIRVIATAYNGRNIELSLPSCNVTVEKSALTRQDAKADFSVFAYALSNPFTEKNVENHKVAELNDFYRIATLRSKEKHSFGPSPAVRKERMKFEQSIGISQSQEEGSIPVYYALTVIFVFFLVCSIILFIIKKKVTAVVNLGVAAFFYFASFFAGTLVNEKHAIVTGGTLSPVPEDSALSSIAITAGTCVRLKEQTEKWYYIEYNENGGWIKKENLILIE